MDYALSLVVFLGIYMILAYALDMAMGHAGLLAFGIGAHYAVGAYVTSILSLHFGFSFWSAIASAIVVTGLFGLASSLVLLRTRGDYFFLASLGLQIILLDLIGNLDALTGGPHGLSGIPKPPSASSLPLSPATQHAILYMLIAALSVWVMRRLLVRGFGNALRAARDDEIAASAFGKQTAWLKVRALALSAAFVGLAGALYAHYVSYIDPASFGFTESVYVLSMVVVGGVGQRLGPFIGACLLLLAPEALRFLNTSSGLDANLRALLYGALLVAFAFWKPGGVVGGKASQS